MIKQNEKQVILLHLFLKKFVFQWLFPRVSPCSSKYSGIFLSENNIDEH